MKDSINNSFFKFSNRKDLIAIKSSEFEISYYSLFNSSTGFSEFLLSYQIGKNDYAAVLTDDQIFFVKSVIALWLIGAVPVPINTKLLDSEIEQILNDHQIKFLISDRTTFSFVSPPDTEIILINNGSKKPTLNTDLKIPEEVNEAVVIFTSGSSGKPRGVVHTFSSLISNIENANSIFKHQEKDKWLASLPFYHIGGFQIICRSLFFGCTLITSKSIQTDDLAESILSFNPTHLSFVSTQLKRMLDKKISPGNSLRVSLIGGGFIDDELLIKAGKLGWKPYRVYGSSETGSMITAISGNEIEIKPLSSGKPFKDVQIKISDNSELLIKSGSLFKYYLNDKKETTEKLINGFYYSGDIGFIDNDGYLFIEARRNDLIITGGENVNPVEVEKVIQKIDGVKEVCVFPQQNKIWGQIVACALVTDDESINETKIKDFLKPLIAGYKIPKKYFFTTELPKTILGKFEREKIRKIFK
ncbi:MAG: AMP-binding protein [Ignavibacterium sp.]|nr:AMP-binding protein [Ignavibacterium sp.]